MFVREILRDQIPVGHKMKVRLWRLKLEIELPLPENTPNRRDVPAVTVQDQHVLDPVTDHALDRVEQDREPGPGFRCNGTLMYHMVF